MLSVKQAISASTNFEVSEIKSSDHLAEELGCDSLDAVEICMALESKYQITIPDDQITTIKTVAGITDCVMAAIEGVAMLCGNCKKSMAVIPHTCPYKNEINDDYGTLCDCCDDCKQRCSDEI